MYSQALVTGATSGIGLACARELARLGLNLVLIARREDRLKSVAEKIIGEFGVHVNTYVLDIRNRMDIEKWAAHADLAHVDVLINNAGLARGTDKMPSARLDDWEEMIDTNIKGLLYITRSVVPHMVTSQKGHVVNLGSVAGRWVYPGGGVYCATKFAVRALSEGLRQDLSGTPIRVTNIEPGMVETEFSQVRMRDVDRAKAVYQGMTPLRDVDIAEAVAWSLSRPAHVNIQELVIFPTDQASVSMVNRR